MRSPNADAYMVVQDDAIFANCRQLKTYVESVLWPITDERCLVSLYCAADDSRDTDGWFEFAGQWEMPINIVFLAITGFIAWHGISFRDEDGKSDTVRLLFGCIALVFFLRVLLVDVLGLV